MTKNIISEQAAKDQFEILVDYYEFEIDDLPDDLKDSVEFAIKKVVKSIMKGRVEISDSDGLKIIQKMKHNENDFEYKAISGSAKPEMKDKDSQYEKIYALLGSLSGWGKQAVKKLEGIDLSTAESLGMILLQV